MTRGEPAAVPSTPLPSTPAPDPMARAATPALPGFLVIGAMKAGTTTLYHDLSRNPAVCLAEKEASPLLAAAPAREYAECFRRGEPGALCGDVSTRYAMLPHSDAVVPAARRLLGRGTRIIYLVREPVARTLSHHNHLRTVAGADRMGPDINVEIRRRPELIAYSRYALQLRPWIDAFGLENVRVVVLEHYARRRREELDALSRWLGIPPCTGTIEEGHVHNEGTARPVVAGLWGRVRSAAVYRRFVRPLTSLRFRDRMRDALLPKVRRDDVPPPTPATIEHIVAGVQDDTRQLCDWLDVRRPPWSLGGDPAAVPAVDAA